MGKLANEDWVCVFSTAQSCSEVEKQDLYGEGREFITDVNWKNWVGAKDTNIGEGDNRWERLSLCTLELKADLTQCKM